MAKWGCAAQLLGDPGFGGVSGHAEMDQASRSELNTDPNLQFDQFSANAFRASGEVLAGHALDERDVLLCERLSAFPLP